MIFFFVKDLLRIYAYGGERVNHLSPSHAPEVIPSFLIIRDIEKKFCKFTNMRLQITNQVTFKYTLVSRLRKDE